MNSKKSDFVKFEQVDKSYDGKELVVKGLDLDIAEGEFLTLLGPSGSGKTTTPVSYTHLRAHETS